LMYMYDMYYGKDVYRVSYMSLTMVCDIHM
jgi:hypothetical protein